jgi:hypothetical protein
VTAFKMENKLYPLAYAADVANPDVSKAAVG